jgi:hypothetical protein
MQNKGEEQNVHTPERRHALEFLLPIDPRHGIRSIARSLWHMAATNDQIASQFAAIQDKMNSGKPLISQEHYSYYRRLSTQLPALNISTAPDWIRPAIAAGYLRAKSAVASGRIRGIYDEKVVSSTLGTVLGFIDKLEPSFVGELLAETVLAAAGDREFARTLAQGANEFRDLAAELYGPDGKDRPAAVARIATGGGGDCTCCVDGQCQFCSCWVIVVIIVIVIVTK